MSIKRETANSLTKSCLQLLALRGVFAFRVNNTGIYDPVRKVFRSFQGMRGVADILGCVGPAGLWNAGRFLAVEIKAGNDTQSPHQLAFEASVRDAGGLYFVVRSVRDLDELLTENGI